MTSITRLVQAVSWKYAIGEIILIVVGVTLALAVNSWAADRERKSEEVAYLREFLLALDEERERFQEAIERVQGVSTSLRALQVSLDNQLPLTQEASDAFSELLLFNLPNISTSAYESLKSRGMELISNDAIRRGLIAVYEERHDNIERSNDIFAGQVIDYWNTTAPSRFNFNAPCPRGECILPFDYESLFDDKEFYGRLTQRIVLIENFMPNFWQQAINDIDALRADLRAEIDRREATG